MEIFLDAILFFSAYNRLDPQCNKEDFKSPKTDLILFFLNIQMMIFSWTVGFIAVWLVLQCEEMKKWEKEMESN